MSKSPAVLNNIGGRACARAAGGGGGGGSGGSGGAHHLRSAVHAGPLARQRGDTPRAAALGLLPWDHCALQCLPHRLQKYEARV